MCGIAGIIKLNGSATSEDVAAVRRMMDAQVHRGPDGEGMHWDSRVVLGHRRLSIIDLSEAGRQPMSNEACAECSRSNGTVWVTYNGEVYNFQELRDELINHGHRFRSKTDTEVLVHGYEQWGMEGLLTRLRGMFAFALYDTGRRSSSSPLTPHPSRLTPHASRLTPHPSPLTPSASRLFLARDRLGIKPLYYYQDGERLIFASEVRALRKSGMVPDEMNIEALVRFLQLGSVPVPLTTIKNVSALSAGHYLVADEKSINLKPYWDLSTYLHQPPTSNLQPPDAFITTTRSLLEDSVRHHLISDVPLGVFLSGGIDSSALVALAGGFRDKPLTTLSVIFDEPDYNEAQYARLVAKKYSTDHREVLLRSKDFFEELPRIFDAMDQPTVDGVNTYFVSKAAKEAGLTVVLSGTGGDEVFLGYDHFKKTRTLERARRLLNVLPLWMRRGLIQAAIQSGLPAGEAGREKLTYLETPSDDNLYFLFRGLFTPRQIQDLLGLSDRELNLSTSSLLPPASSLQPRPSNLQPPTSSSLLNSFTLFEFRHYLQNQLLRDTDFMSMAHSIETRVPYLDHRLVEHVAGLSPKSKLGNGMNKPLLVKAMGEGLPRKIWDRPKMGFTFPFGEWLKERSDELKAGCLESKILDRKAVEAIWKGFGKSRAHWSRPWALCVLREWVQ